MDVWLWFRGLPISTNRIWRYYGGMRESPEYRQYRKEVGKMLTANGSPRCPWRSVSVTVWLFPPDRRKFDADNRFKALFDALSDSKDGKDIRFWKDDSVVCECRAVRIAEPVERGATVVKVEPREETDVSGADIPEAVKRRFRVRKYKGRKKDK